MSHTLTAARMPFVTQGSGARRYNRLCVDVNRDIFLMRWHVERGESQGRISHHVVAQWSGGDVFVYVREITEVSEDVKRTHGKVQ